MSRCLIVNADDLGCSLGVTRGIIRAHREGIVTSASVMINMPAAAESLQMMQREAPDLGLGLHLNLTTGPPVVAAIGEIPDLVDADGVFRHKSEITAALPTINIAQVERELRAQIELFSALVGHPPDHLDSHHHITYLSPPVMSLMACLAGELGIPIRKPFDSPAIAIRFLRELGFPGGETLTGELIGALNRAVDEAGVRMPDHFISRFYRETATLGDLLNLLVDLPEGVSELMCHPGEVDKALRAISGYTDHRLAELEALTHPSAQEVIRSEGIELGTFRRLHA